MFTQETNNLCHASLSDVLLVNSVYNENENFLFLRPKMWDTVPKRIKKMKTVEAFKIAAKNRKLLCRLVANTRVT